MTDSADQRRHIQAGLKRLSISANALARKAGLHKTTVLRALSENPKHAPSSRTLDTLQRALERIAMEMGAQHLDAISDQAVDATTQADPRKSFDDIQDRISTMVGAIILLIDDAISAKLDLSIDGHMKVREELRDLDLKLAIAAGLDVISADTSRNIRKLDALRKLVVDRQGLTAMDPELFEAIADIAGETRRDAVQRDPMAAFMHICSMIIVELTGGGTVAEWTGRLATEAAR